MFSAKPREVRFFYDVICVRDEVTDATTIHQNVMQVIMLIRHTDTQLISKIRVWFFTLDYLMSF